MCYRRFYSFLFIGEGMIKIEKDKLFMTAGETCYIVSASDGVLRAVYFGRRVEAEDDLSALLGASNVPEFAPVVNGKKTEFALVGAEVLAEKPNCSGMHFAGGKTLKATVRSGSLTAEIYYTPYPRGGFSRQVVLVNGGGTSVTVGDPNNVRLRGEHTLTALDADGGVFAAAEVGKRSRCIDNFLAISDGDGAYGFLCVYGDGAVCGKAAGGVTEITCNGYGEITLKAGERYVAPELLAVYSDNGIDGMSRVLHDILRESLQKSSLSERKQVVLFCPTMSESKLVKAAGETVKLGCDVFAVDAGEVSVGTLGKLSEACKAAGIKLGIKLSPFSIKKSSAAYNGKCVAAGERYTADISVAEGAAAHYATLEKLIKDNEIEYLMYDIPRGGLQKYAQGVHGVRSMLATNFPELTVDWGIVPKKLRRGRLMCYPPSMMRVAAEPNGDGTLKQAFDEATVGCLSYWLDPLSLTDGMVRAVRAQVFSYQDDAPAVMNGDLYIATSDDGDCCYISVTKDKSRAYVVCSRATGGETRVRLKGLDEHNLYNVRELGATFSGAALRSCGVILPDAPTCCLHVRQVADYE